MADQVRRFAFSHRSVVRGYSSRRLGTQVAFTLPPPSPTTDGFKALLPFFRLRVAPLPIAETPVLSPRSIVRSLTIYSRSTMPVAVLVAS